MLLLASMLVSEPDDTIVHELEQFIVVSNCVHSTQLNSSQPSAVVDKSYIQTHFSGSLAGTLGHVAGVQAMSVGSSVARPAIRGLGFNRLAVMHDDVRHEGQQWASDAQGWVFNKDYAIPAGSVQYIGDIDIEIPAEAAEGDYHFMLRLTDHAGWQTIKAVPIRIEE